MTNFQLKIKKEKLKIALDALEQIEEIDVLLDDELLNEENKKKILGIQKNVTRQYDDVMDSILIDHVNIDEIKKLF